MNSTQSDVLGSDTVQSVAKTNTSGPRTRSLEMWRWRVSDETGTNVFCVYCGDFYQCRDHVIPLAWLRVYRDYRPGETVYCCMMCNQSAGSYPARNVQDKAFYLIHRYQHKYAKVLALPNWEEDEIDELEGMLKDYIKGNTYLKQVLMRKLENLDLVSLGFPAVEIKNYFTELALKAVSKTEGYTPSQ